MTEAANDDSKPSLIICYDTETSGLPSKHYCVPLDTQPHIVQLAAVLVDDAGQEWASMNVIIKPEGWTIPDDVAKIHGITQAIAESVGIPIVSALSMFVNLAKKADRHIAHNKQFDDKLIDFEMQRIGRQWVAVPGSVDTMIEAAPIVNLPPTPAMVRAGRNNPKSPKLEECIQHFFGESLDGAHDALVDVRACLRVYFHLRRNQVRAA